MTKRLVSNVFHGQVGSHSSHASKGRSPIVVLFKLRGRRRPVSRPPTVPTDIIISFHYHDDSKHTNFLCFDFTFYFDDVLGAYKLLADPPPAPRAGRLAQARRAHPEKRHRQPAGVTSAPGLLRRGGA